MATTQLPTIPHCATIADLLRAALALVPYDHEGAASLVADWLDADPALRQQFGRDLWLRGIRDYLRTMSNNTRKTITVAASHPQPSLPQHTGTPTALPPTDPSWHPSLPSSVPAPAPFQRPTGAAHLGKARLIADAKRLMDFPLADHFPLWQAKKRLIVDYAIERDEQIATMVHRRTWLMFVAEALPNDRVTVGEALTEAKLQELWQQAEKTPSA